MFEQKKDTLFISFLLFLAIEFHLVSFIIRPSYNAYSAAYLMEKEQRIIPIDTKTNHSNPWKRYAEG